MFLYIAGLVIALLLLVYLLQISLLPMFYQNTVLNTVEQTANELNENYESMQYSSQYDANFNWIRETAQENNLCIYIFNEEAIMQFEFNAMGSACYLNYLIKPSARSYFNPSMIMNQYITQFQEINSDSYYFEVSPNTQLTSQLFYAKEISTSQRPYYVFINTPFELLNTTIGVLQKQFLLIIVGLLILGGLVSFLISRIFSIPLINLSNVAKRLGTDKEVVTFEPQGITEIDNLADTLTLASQNIRRNDDVKNDLLANVSHDIRTPLTLISAYAEMIQDISGDDKEMRNQHLTIIQNEVTQLNNLLTDMMTLSLMQSQSTRLDQETFDIKPMIQQLVDSNDGLDNIDITFENNAKSLVVGDPVKIRQVIMNYLSNAKKFVGQDNQIIIRLIEIDETGYVRVEVEDHGDGIKEEDIAYIWDRYYKVNKNYQRIRQGTGLGLAISKAICEKGGYPYGVISILKEKTIFFIEIPIA